mmetsp:Transcript_6107/g.13179  ORF Transcript_6107/g.13179 Transcript_6107/m.13179 type:complete len:84 (+) Transcript_6107:809-1060(+)
MLQKKVVRNVEVIQGKKVFFIRTIRNFLTLLKGAFQGPTAAFQDDGFVCEEPISAARYPSDFVEFVARTLIHCKQVVCQRNEI